MADEILKAKLQQISDNDEQIGTDSLEIKGQVNALRQYGMGVTGIQRDRLGDVVYDLADGYGQSGGSEPLIDEVFYLPERTTSAQTIQVALSKTITSPQTNEMYMFLWEYLGDVEVAPRDDMFVFRKLETDIIHTNTLFIGIQANVGNYISKTGIIAYGSAGILFPNISRIGASTLNINNPAIQAQYTYPSGNWRIRGWKIADAPTI